MFDWLVVMLGGHTKREMDMQATVVDSWTKRALAAETTVELVKDILEKERDRSQKLTESLYYKMNPGQGQTPPEMEPLGNGRTSWPRIRRQLEKQHRVNDNAEVSREKIESEIRSGQ